MQRMYVLPRLPERDERGHKGTFGRVLVVGGSGEMLGAGVLAGTAALRSGAGWVQLAMHRTLLGSALSVTPELVGLALGETAKEDSRLLAAAERATAIVVGPGMGVSPLARKRLVSLLKLGKPTVVDADAITMLGAMKKWPAMPSRCVITPHPVELARLTGHFGGGGGGLGIAKGPPVVFPASERGRIDWAGLAATKLGVVVVLKGAGTVVAENGTAAGRLYVEPTITSALAKAGTGDVLAGILGTLMAQMDDTFSAAVLAVHLHARAGVLAGERLGVRSVLARDVITELGHAIREAK